MWRVIKTTDGRNLGERLLTAEQGQIITFRDGSVVVVQNVYKNKDETQLIVDGGNYQLTLSKEHEEE